MTFRRLVYLPAALAVSAFGVCASESVAQVETGAIFARVMAEDGTPLPGVLLHVEAVRGGFTQEGTTGPTGAVRFASIPVGVYNVTSTLQGFTSVRHEDLRIGIGQTVSLDVVFRPAVAEAVTVVAEAPIVDTKKTGEVTNFSQEFLDRVPTGRDPWVIMEQTAGIDGDRQNVGGSESGQGTLVFARAGTLNNNLWVLDGLNIGDPAASGASPLYYDFDSFEEIQVLTAGNDPSIPTGGIVINMITKRPGNFYAGTASVYYDSDGTQWENDAKLEERGGTGDRIDQIADYGIEAGGPVVKDRIFGWFAYRKNDIRQFLLGNPSARTVLEDVNTKGIFQLNEKNESTVGYTFGSNTKDNRIFLAPDQQAPETAWDETFPAWLLRFEHRFTPNDKFFTSFKYGHIRMPFELFTKAGRDPQTIVRLNNDFYWENNSYDFAQIQDGNVVNIDANYFQDDWAGGDHEFKFGFEYKHFAWTSFSNYGGDVALYDVTGSRGGDAGSGTAKLKLDYHPDVTIARTSFYVNDAFRKGRVTLNLGFRFDHQRSTNNPSVAPANRLAPDILPAVEFAGNDPGSNWNTVSPRLGASIDITGDGKTVLRGNFARYYDQLSGRVPFAINPLGNPFGAYVAYADLNGDAVVTRNELMPEVLLQGFGGALPFNPQAAIDRFLSARAIQEDLRAPSSHEFLLGIEREVAPQLAISATYVYRRYKDFLGSFVDGVSPQDFTVPIPVQTESGFDVTVWDTPFVPADRKTEINVDDRFRVYHGLDIIATKPLRDNWLLSGSFNWQNQKEYFDSEAAFQDPTNIPFIDERWFAPRSRGSGRGEIFPGSRFSFKLSGLYQLPHEMSVGGYFKVIDGNVSPFELRQPTNFNSVSGSNLYFVQDFDAFRLDTLVVLDLRFEKIFDLGRAGKLSGMVDMFNVFNNDYTLGINRRADSRDFGQINWILSPRVLRFGLKYKF
jgi:hypothetical protein